MGTGHRVTVAAADLGAETGRVVGASFDGERLEVREQGRFAHAPSPVDGVLRWEVDALWTALSGHLAALAAATPGGLASVGVDTWGVDYGLLDHDGDLVDRPTCYRDPRQVAPMLRAVEAVGRERLHARTGTQTSEILTLFALMDDAARTSRLERAEVLLMLPDVFHHLLAGSRVTEHTAASTTGMYDVARGRWAVDLVEELGVPSRVLPEVVAPGTDLGPVVGDLAGALAGTRVVAPAGHDTASAVAATPFAEPGSLFLSSGTWSLVGVERTAAVLTPEALAAGLTNEGGCAGTVLLLRNVMGLWLLQECRRQWAREGTDLSYADLADLAAAEPLLASVVNPNAPEFLAPGDMPARVRAYCARTGSPVPQTPGAVARCVVDSLALLYRLTAEDVTAVTGARPPAVQVTGGGASHAVLAQATADATGLPVHCGPVEATALGNAGVQLVALGHLGGLDDVRAAVARATRLRSWTPHPDGRWDEAAVRLRRLCEQDERRRGLVGTA